MNKCYLNTNTPIWKVLIALVAVAMVISCTSSRQRPAMDSNLTSKSQAIRDVDPDTDALANAEAFLKNNVKGPHAYGGSNPPLLVVIAAGTSNRLDPTKLIPANQCPGDTQGLPCWDTNKEGVGDFTAVQIAIAALRKAGWSLCDLNDPAKIHYAFWGFGELPSGGAAEIGPEFYYRSPVDIGVDLNNVINLGGENSAIGGPTKNLISLVYTSKNLGRDSMLFQNAIDSLTKGVSQSLPVFIVSHSWGAAYTGHMLNSWYPLAASKLNFHVVGAVLAAAPKQVRATSSVFSDEDGSKCGPLVPKESELCGGGFSGFLCHLAAGELTTIFGPDFHYVVKYAETCKVPTCTQMGPNGSGDHPENLGICTFGKDYLPNPVISWDHIIILGKNAKNHVHDTVPVYSIERLDDPVAKANLETARRANEDRLGQYPGMRGHDYVIRRNDSFTLKKTKNGTGLFTPIIAAGSDNGYDDGYLLESAGPAAAIGIFGIDTLEYSCGLGHDTNIYYPGSCDPSTDPGGDFSGIDFFANDGSTTEYPNMAGIKVDATLRNLLIPGLSGTFAQPGPSTWVSFAANDGDSYFTTPAKKKVANLDNSSCKRGTPSWHPSRPAGQTVGPSALSCEGTCWHGWQCKDGSVQPASCYPEPPPQNPAGQDNWTGCTSDNDCQSIRCGCNGGTAMVCLPSVAYPKACAAASCQYPCATYGWIEGECSAGWHCKNGCVTQDGCTLGGGSSLLSNGNACSSDGQCQSGWCACNGGNSSTCQPNGTPRLCAGDNWTHCAVDDDCRSGVCGCDGGSVLQCLPDAISYPKACATPCTPCGRVAEGSCYNGSQCSGGCLNYTGCVPSSQCGGGICVGAYNYSSCATVAENYDCVNQMQAWLGNGQPVDSRNYFYQQLSSCLCQNCYHYSDAPAVCASYRPSGGGTGGSGGGAGASSGSPCNRSSDCIAGTTCAYNYGLQQRCWPSGTSLPNPDVAVSNCSSPATPCTTAQGVSTCCYGGGEVSPMSCIGYPRTLGCPGIGSNSCNGGQCSGSSNWHDCQTAILASGGNCSAQYQAWLGAINAGRCSYGGTCPELTASQQCQCHNCWNYSDAPAACATMH